jgi:excisionase family DNA binding protein
MDEELKRALQGAKVPLWPEGAKALNMKRSAVYRAAQRGELPVLRIGRGYVLKGAPFRRLLGMDGEAA